MKENNMEKNQFVPALEGMLYGEFDENHRLIIRNQVEAFKEGLPAVEIETAYDGTIWRKGCAPAEPAEHKNAREIENLKSFLTSTDWIVVKISEETLRSESKSAAEDLEKYKKTLDERSAARARINELEGGVK